MTSSSSRVLPFAASVLAVVLATVALAPPAAAATTYTTSTDPARVAAGWLSTQFVDASHLPAPGGDHFDSLYGSDYYANYGMNADVIFGLAAAKTGATTATRALDYLADNIDGYADLSGQAGGPYDGSIAKLSVAASVLGLDPKAFRAGGKALDLISLLTGDECAAASDTCAAPGSARNIYSSISESFVVLAQARAGTTPSSAAVGYLLSLQCPGGGFTDTTAACSADGSADVDATSYAIMALRALGGHAAQLAAATSWLTSQQKPGGYWIAQDIPNTNSTGLAASALQSTGADVAKARTWLRAQQVGAAEPGAGAMRYDATFTATTASATSPSVIATAQALVGLTDSSSLATLTATGSDDDVALLAPAVLAANRTVAVGGRASVRASGFVAGERVRVELHSAPVRVATVTADPSGVLAATFRVPTGVAVGPHSVVLTGATSGLTAARSLTVTAAPGAGSSTGSSTGSSAGSTGSGSTSGSAVAGAAGGADPIAATGLAGPRLVGVGVSGAASVAIGLALLLAGVRRRPARHRA